jgi:ABC-type dipeptide/oligopeptide/nickel transport system permease subunit
MPLPLAGIWSRRRGRAAAAGLETPGRSTALARFGRGTANRIGVGILVVIVLAALFAPWLAPHDPYRMALSERLRPPLFAGGTLSYALGTDELGRDLLSRIIYGARISLLAGFPGAVGAALLGTALGLIAGHFGRRVDAVVMRLVDIWMAFPFILVALTFIAVLGPGLRNLIIVFTLTGWPVFARVTRAAALTLREQEFVLAARALGAGSGRIIMGHLLPNLISPVLVLFSFQVGSLIMAEAALSFLGLGVRPPTAAWGSMMAGGREFIREAWWLSTLPGVALAATVLGVNLVGDGLRDALDAKIDAQPSL